MAQAKAEAQEAEQLLAECESERRELRDRYLSLGGKVDLLLRQETTAGRRCHEARPVS